MQKFDSEIIDPVSLETHIGMLNKFCETKGLQFKKIYHDYMNRENSDDWKLEERIHETESKELIHRYYSSTQIYLYELTLQECGWDYINLFNSLSDFAKQKNIKKALDYGGGIGGLCIHLNSKGICCDYADVPGHTWDYAGYRFEHNKTECSQLSEDILKRKASSYDLIVSLDCLEHLKPLPDYIRAFNFLLTDDGFLLVKSAFFGKGLHLQSNHAYHCLKTFNEMMRLNGFDFQGQLITRLGRNFLIPAQLLKLFNIHTASGKKLIYKKTYE